MTKLLSAEGKGCNIIYGAHESEIVVKVKDSEEGFFNGHDEKLQLILPKKLMEHLKEKLIKHNALKGRNLKIKLEFELN